MENIAIYVIIIKEKGIKKGIKMKYLVNISATKEEKEKLFSVGEAFHPVTNFTRADFLTPAMVGKKFDLTTKEAMEFMKKLCSKRAVFVLNGHKMPIILRMNRYLYLHPMAVEAFQQQINQRKK